MTRPNFFIVGAPKCGTTSLAAWLSSHPNVFMPVVKEPTFFNVESRHRPITSLGEYERLFEGADGRHIAVGEASVWYLRSRAAIDGIEAYSPKARYIVMLRNPADMAVSLHAQKIVSGEENILNFEEAWRAQSARQQGMCIPATCPEPEELLYGEVCKLGEQLEALYGVVDKERVLVLFFDDLKVDPSGVYAEALEFLGLPAHTPGTFAVHNARKQLVFPRLNRFLRSGSLFLHRIGVGRTGIASLVSRFNARPSPKHESRDNHEFLKPHFGADIRLIEKLTGRQLDSWR